ncbi:MAG: hypothetical protein KJ601_01285, partial [Nanoarchaeota archaeon]|nr:hypothetical protein [Nanoarchaeota archaeon]
MKKAQSELFRVLMVAAIVIMLLFFGWRGIANIQKKSCDSRLAVFEAEIRSSVEAAATDTGSREEWKGSVPCGAEKIIFVDKSKDVSFEYFDSAYPEIYDTIFPERTRDNAF